MKLKSLKINDRIQPINEPHPAGGYLVVGVDLVGPMLVGPCVVVDWDGRGMETFRRVRASELESWELMIPTSETET